jgi:signal transduction histidine kinase
VTVYLAAELPPIEGDRVELQQVLINLIVNAADAMEVVPIGARMLAIRTEATPNGQRMCVGDSGPGISPSDLKSIFEPFWTTKPRGMGMGLAICRTIMTAHRGTLNAWNSPQGGATFCLGLPLRREAGEAA